MKLFIKDMKRIKEYIKYLPHYWEVPLGWIALFGWAIMIIFLIDGILQNASN